MHTAAPAASRFPDGTRSAAFPRRGARPDAARSRGGPLAARPEPRRPQRDPPPARG